MIQTNDKIAPPADGILKWAFWLNALLVILAVPLSIFYLMILANAKDVPLGAVIPLFYAGIAVVHMSCLMRQRFGAEPPGLIPHGLIAASGITSVVGLFLALIAAENAGMFFPLVLAGAVIAFTVSREFAAQLKDTLQSRTA